MSRKPHPADIADRARIAEAVEFTAHLRRGPFDKITERFPTLAEAAKRAEAIQDANPGRKALVYAILQSGAQVLVPKDMREASTINAERETKAMTKLSGTDISKLTAMITGGAYKRANTREAAVKRFIKVAAEAGISTPGGLLDLPFETASADLQAELNVIRSGRKLKAAQAAAKAEKPAGTVKPAKATKPTGKRAAILEAAQRGELPAVPDFSAATHTRFRKKLGEVVALVEAGDLEGLRSFHVNPVSSSPKAIARYRDLAVIALEARGKA